MTSYRKLFFAGITVMVMLALAGSLSNLELLPGDPLLLKQLLQWIGENLLLRRTENWETTMGGKFLIGFFKVIIPITLVSLPFAVIYFIISPEFRKRVMKQMASMCIILAGVYLIARSRAQDSLKKFLDKASNSPPLEVEQAWKSFDKFAAAPSYWLIPLANFVFALSIALLLVYIVRLVWWRPRRLSPHPLTELAGAAQNALNIFQAGGDFTNTVIRCYVEMNRALEAQRGIRRQEAMTPREFETYLNNIGLPLKPVQQLTRIFEDVRYGTKIPGKDEERQAIASLTAIIETCRNGL